MANRLILFCFGIVFTAACSSDPKEKEQVLFETPLDSINAIIQNEPNNAVAFAARALIQLEARNLAEAQSDAKKAMELDSINPIVLENYGDIYLMLNQTRISRDSWKTCAELNRNNISCRFKLAKLLFFVRNYEESLDYLNEILMVEGANDRALFLKASIYKELGDTSSAIQFYQTAIDANPENFDAYEQLGVLYAQREDSLAIAFYNRAIQLRPNEPGVYYNLGIYYQSKEQWNRALEAYSSAVQIDPNHFNSHYNMGYIHILISAWGQGAVHFTDAIRAKDDYYQAYYGRAYCFEMLGDVTRAKKDYEQALNIKLDYKPAEEGLGRIAKLLQYGN
jgi:tetratricopeptide (TPR) repeat protein